jgi:hypothetical protein
MRAGSIDESFGLGARAVPPARVDDALLPAALAAEVRLPRVLDPGGADRVAGFVAERVESLLLVARHVLVPGRAVLG